MKCQVQFMIDAFSIQGTFPKRKCLRSAWEEIGDGGNGGGDEGGGRGDGDGDGGRGTGD